MSDMFTTTNLIPLAHVMLARYAKETGKPISEVVEEYGILLRPWTNAEEKIRYFESLARFHGDLATFYSGPRVFESKGNQRKLLILRYFSERDCATSDDISSDLNVSLTNASERLKRYYKQRLLTRRQLEARKRGRPTMVYKLTEVGRRRFAFLEKTVKFKRKETYRSKEYRTYQSIMEDKVKALRLRALTDDIARG